MRFILPANLILSFQQPDCSAPPGGFRKIAKAERQARRHVACCGLRADQGSSFGGARPDFGL
jgi:hypothetical protein